MKKPTYSLEDFLLTCGETPSKVFPIYDTLDDARNIFKLKTKSELLDFILNGGLENLEFINSKIWEENPSPSVPIFVDAYHFKSLYMLGYIAFFKNNSNGNWMIKSFHLSDQRNTELEIKLKDHLKKIKGKNNG
jgi:hypothetical protein